MSSTPMFQILEIDLEKSVRGNEIQMQKTFLLDRYDDDGFYVEDYTQVNEGELFELCEDPFRVIGGEIRLVGISTTNYGQWLEISKETLVMYFEEVKERDDNAR